MQRHKIVIALLRFKPLGTCLFTFWISTYLMLSFKSKPNESRSRTLFFRRQVLKLLGDRFLYVKCRNLSIAQICKINYKLYQLLVMFNRMLSWRILNTRRRRSPPWPFLIITASNIILVTVKNCTGAVASNSSTK